MVDLPKTFDCVSHDILPAKSAVYDVDESFLCYIYSYILNWKQCVWINNIDSDFQNVVSGVPQGSIVTNSHKSADDNTLTAFANNIQNLIHLLESESRVTIKWFKDNKMIVNPGKFKAIILDKKKNNYTHTHKKKIDSKAVTVKLNWTKFQLTHCESSVANDLNALISLESS